MKHTSLFSFCILILSNCNPIIKEFDVYSVDVRKLKPITDSITKLDLILKNDTISGFDDWTFSVKDALSNSIFYKYCRNRFDSCFWRHTDSVFYLLDSIKIKDNIGYVILSNVYNKYSIGFDRTIYLSFFNHERKNIKTYVVSKGKDSGNGLIGGGGYSKSKLFKNNMLKIYCNHYGYIDIGPEFNKDSILYYNDLNLFSLFKIDTIMTMHQYGYIKTIKENGKIKTINLREK